MLIKNLFFLFILFMISTKAFAIGNRCESIFSEAPHFKGIYNHGMCPDNIYHLAEDLKRQHPEEDFTKSEVLYVYSRWTGDYRYDMSTTTFKAFRARNGHPTPWAFHVVLLHKGRIYDYDHNKKNKTVSLKTYFSEMYGAEIHPKSEGSSYVEKAAQYYQDYFDEPKPPLQSQLRMHIRSIPMEVYLAEYSFDRSRNKKNKEKNFEYWVYGDERFPDQTMEHYLTSKNSG